MSYALYGLSDEREIGDNRVPNILSLPFTLCAGS